MSKSASATRFIPIMLVGAAIVCGCFVLGATFLFFNYQSPVRSEPSIPLPQSSAPTQMAVPPVQREVPVQRIPGYTDFLGKNQYDPNFLDMSQGLCGLGDSNNNYVWVCPTLSIAFNDSQGDGIIDQVWIYAAGYANFKEYTGEMPNGLAWGDTYNDVVGKIGQPDSASNYGWAYTNLGIKVYYQTDSPSMPDPSETIQYILVFLP